MHDLVHQDSFVPFMNSNRDIESFQIRNGYQKLFNICKVSGVDQGVNWLGAGG